MTYAEIGTVINEFQAPRWQKVKYVFFSNKKNELSAAFKHLHHCYLYYFQETIQNITIGNRILINHGLYYSWHFYWISIGALFGSIILFYIAFGLALDYITCKFATIEQSAYFSDSSSMVLRQHNLTYSELGVMLLEISILGNTPGCDYWA